MPEIIAASTFRPQAGRAAELLALLTDLRREIRAEPGNLEYSINRSVDPDHDALLVIQAFESEDAFTAHGTRMAAIDAPARIAALIVGPLTRPELFERSPDPSSKATAAATSPEPPVR